MALQRLPVETMSTTNLTESERTTTFGGIRHRVWRYICDNPGCTTDQIRVALALHINTARPRRIELEHAGLIRMVFPPAVDALGNITSRYEATGEPYPEHWRAPTAKDGTAMAVRSVRRLREWAQYKGDAALLDAVAHVEARLREIA